MYPSDEWVEALNFYLIVASGGALTMSDFSDAELHAAWLEHPGMTMADLDPAAEKLVLEFQAKQKDTEAKDDSPLPQSQAGEIYEELPNGPVSVPMLGVPGDF
ncbi:MAG: hypothetical protein HS126_40365 [Anaerolineales bacterium]|nr:hypothetical protein [Anaerolineales bacterium]